MRVKNHADRYGRPHGGADRRNKGTLGIRVLCQRFNRHCAVQRQKHPVPPLGCGIDHHLHRPGVEIRLDRSGRKGRSGKRHLGLMPRRFQSVDEAGQHARPPAMRRQGGGPGQKTLFHKPVPGRGNHRETVAFMGIFRQQNPHQSSPFNPRIRSKPTSRSASTISARVVKMKTADTAPTSGSSR